ncbi:MAG TPA: hypothetical protein PLL00_04200 [Bacteroidia bacterium]|nr:hypothetical protein [Bacteroidia bacterium]
MLQFKTIAQPALDTIQWCIKQKPHIFGKLDTRNSFIYNSRIKIFGMKAGVSYGKRLFIGLGYNQIYPNTKAAKSFDKQIYIPTEMNTMDSVTAKLQLFYFSAQIEYIYYRTKHWQLSMPLQIGIGQTSYKYEWLGKRRYNEKYACLIYEPAVSVEYRFVKWIGVGADVGFRFMLTESKALNNKFNSPTYAFKLLIYYSEIFKSLFPNSKLSEKL